MSTPELERLLSLARGAQPAEPPQTDVRRQVRRAVAAAAERRAHAQRRRWLVLAGALCSVLVALGPWSPLHRMVRERMAARAPASVATPVAAHASTTWRPLELALPTGDRLAASPGAQFELLQTGPRSRRIALRSGSAVFSVEPLASGETFAVQTPHAYVEVRGTVFSVDVEAGATRVRVHEGAVQVQGEAGVRALRAGERYGSDGREVPELAPPLAARARQLVAEREGRAAGASARDASIGPGAEPPLEHAASAISLEHARSLLDTGDAEGALAAALAATPARAARGEWRMLEGDALRSLGRARAAVDAYARAEAALAAPADAQAAFKAADLCLRVLSDPAATLRVIDRSRLDADGAPLRERALLLRIEASQRLGLPIHELAERYLSAYPDSAGAEHVRSLRGVNRQGAEAAKQPESAL